MSRSPESDTSRSQAAAIPARPRRTQEQRRAETTRKLLDATLQSVLEVGYSATTTRRVAELAGVSQGAQTHHFPHRVDLVGAAVEELAERRIRELQDLSGELPTDPVQRVEALLDLLWNDFSSSTFTVVVKLWVAAADDPELHARLVAAERRIGRAISTLIRSFGGELSDSPGWQDALQLALSAVRGLALTQQFEPRGRAGRDLWPQVRRALIESFEPRLNA
jgi:AcrR family transcriptional regulator